jgi:hypothetical protein
MDENEDWWMRPWVAPRAWHTLVLVCQRWRSVVLASPVYLKLFLICTERTPVKEMLHIWPSLPLLIRWPVDPCHATNNVIVALEQRDRVRWIVGDVNCFKAEGIPSVMFEPFPALTHLDLHYYGRPLVHSGRFLGRSAPRLQFL